MSVSIGYRLADSSLSFFLLSHPHGLPTRLLRGLVVVVMVVSVVWSLSLVQLFVTSWTVARQAPLPMRLPSQEHCSELPFPSPGDPSKS